MKLHYHKDWRGNFGDDLNIPFFNSIAPSYKVNKADMSLYGIGTLLNNNNGIIKNACVFGSGYGYGVGGGDGLLKYCSKTTLVFGVRGFLTADKMGLKDEKVIGDPALYTKFLDSIREPELESDVVVALHHRTCELWNFDAFSIPGITFLDPGAVSLGKYISTIAGAKIVYAESMHAAIVAAALGVPFFPVSVYCQLHALKWMDFFSVLGFEWKEPIKIPPPKYPVARRILVSGRARKFIDPKHSGVEVLEGELFRIWKRVNAVKIKPYADKYKKVSSLQSKLEDAIGEFNYYLNHG